MEVAIAVSTMRPDDIRFWLLLWLIVSTSSTWGLLAIWAALATRHWFARTALLIGGAWVLALVPAYDLMIVFTAETVCIVAPLLIWRGWRAVAKQSGVRVVLSGIRFRLRDILLITATCAAVAALVRRLPADLQDTWMTYAMWGAACGCTVTAACCALLGGRTLILTAVTPLVAAFLPVSGSGSLGRYNVFKSAVPVRLGLARVGLVPGAGARCRSHLALADSF